MAVSSPGELSNGPRQGPHTPRSYDSIGTNYALRRNADPFIASLILDALGDAKRIVNVGSGSGSYEPSDRFVVGVDPSMTMLAQRPETAGPRLLARAEDLPFEDDSFDASMAVLTVHHWSDRSAGYEELKRVAPKRVVLTYEPDLHGRLWIVADYVPEIARLDEQRPGFCVDEVARGVDATEILPVPVPANCLDGFIMAYWRRPEAFFDPEVRKATSGFSLVGEEAVSRGLAKLRSDLDSGMWHKRHGELLELDHYDAGLRLLVSDRRA